MRKIFLTFFPFAVAITLLCGLLYTAVQQNYRQSAYDPQIQAAEDAAQALGAGADPRNVVPPYQTDIAKSLSPYIILFADQGQTVISSAVLDGKSPSLPGGVLDYTRAHGEDRFTWQPAPGVRSAVVVDAIKNASSGVNMGFVAVGRSLREVEQREDNLLKMVALGWIVTLVAVFAMIWLAMCLHKKEASTNNERRNE
jgi:hypothetical protein